MVRERAEKTNQEKGELMRRRIMAVAVPMIAQQGGRGISLAKVAAVAGISKTGLLHHFGTKDALLHAALDVRDEEDGYPEIWSAEIGIGFLDVIVAYIENWVTRPDTLGMFSMLLAENKRTGDPLHDRLVKHADDVRNLIVATVEVAKRDGQIDSSVDSKVTAIEVFIFLNGIESYFQLDATLPLSTIANHWRESCLHAWRPRGEEA
ncbi:TetR/AcrR family transcriptional regulator [Paenarthrobacter sp. NPDC056912]|uniref:TetR/AcrR family transcriptional regulator n=1 Tax=Paenarthrobacter sp. NPDC056912 TaxID=3345965 RepID=UPI00366BC9D1